MRIALVAGEASGDLLGAHLIEAIERQSPATTFFGVGGPKMARAGMDVWWPAEELAVRGYVEVLRHYARITRLRRRLLQRLLDAPPDVFIGIDAPDFNLWLEARLRRFGVKTVHYVSPSVWAWRGGRINKIARACDFLLAFFPFEPPLYEKTGLRVAYVGHPLADLLPLDVDRAAVRERLGISAEQKPIFALLPGSRQSELDYHAELFLQTANLLKERFAHALFLVPLVSRETREKFEAALWRLGAQNWPIKLMYGHAQDALAAADAALVASGTATLEAALLKTPMVITYRMSPWSWFLIQRMRYQPWVGLPNILAERFLVPELLQEQATPERLAEALAFQATDEENRRMLWAAFHEMHLQLRQGTAEKAAHAILSLTAMARERS
ncbi:MAG: lipid-A-disaccharide synthase [Rhodocyclaceae bacterium]|nr:lipid-A-disaccharide synthase [Rhodocyclaceae bacterium]